MNGDGAITCACARALQARPAASCSICADAPLGQVPGKSGGRLTSDQDNQSRAAHRQSERRLHNQPLDRHRRKTGSASSARCSPSAGECALPLFSWESGSVAIGSKEYRFAQTD